MPVVLLNHDFVTGMAHRDDLRAILVGHCDSSRYGIFLASEQTP